MRSRTLLIVLSCCCSGAPVAADIYRCDGEHGEPVYSRRPCDGARLVELPAAVGSASRTPASGIRESERRWLAERERARRDARARRPAAGPVPATESAGRDAAQRYQCRRRARALDAVQARLRRGYKPAEGPKLRRQRDGYEDYLDAFCD